MRAEKPRTLNGARVIIGHTKSPASEAGGNVPLLFCE